MSGDSMWEGFAAAVVRVELPDGGARLEPRPAGDVGVFPLAGPVFIVTASNPAGLAIDDTANEVRHRLLGEAVAGIDTFPTVGSAPDGSMAEPGFALSGVSLDHALGLAREFGQRAIYHWTAEALTIVGVDEPEQVQLGWALSPQPEP